jgi:hypothetical protein
MKNLNLFSYFTKKIGLCLFFSLPTHMGFLQYQEWKHFSIDPILPGSLWGTGGIGLADFNGDGYLDMALCRRETQSAYWYEYINDSTWERHIMDSTTNLEDALGGTAIDINRDGNVDVAFEGVWFENPGTLGQNPDTFWIQHPIDIRAHDFVSIDIDSDGYEDLVTYNGHELSWYDTSANLEKTVITSGHSDHGGVSPHGFGDISSNGHIDLVIPGFWFENPGSITGRWIKHEWPFIPVPNASYGRSIRSWVVDINQDGKNDIIYSICDTGNSHVYWVENKDNGKNWVSYQLDDPPVREGDVPGTGSFHSLAVADFNMDGTPDIFAGEQEDPDQMWGELQPMKPKGLKERGVIWYNDGSALPKFTVEVIQYDNPGWHDAQIGDVDNDGDIDIVSKVWNADGDTYHADFWRNDLIDK